LGIGWAGAWYAWFRDSPPHEAGQVRESAQTRGDHSFPWRTAFRSPSALALLGTAFCYVYVYNFFQTWFHTFLVKGRGFSETGLMLSALPYAVAALANLTGGAVSDALARKLGPTWGRRTLGVCALGIAGVFTLAAMLSRTQVLTVVFLTVVYGGITFQQSGVFGVCLDIGKKHAGAMVGLMNASAQVGGLVGAVAYGYIVEHFGSYDAPFVPMAALLFLGALLWFRIDASQELHAA
jgi:predicted MFS family arabinose efflux permease